jgi:hypothetical protein
MVLDPATPVFFGHQSLSLWSSRAVRCEVICVTRLCLISSSKPRARVASPCQECEVCKRGLAVCKLVSPPGYLVVVAVVFFLGYRLGQCRSAPAALALTAPALAALQGSPSASSSVSGPSSPSTASELRRAGPVTRRELARLKEAQAEPLLYRHKISASGVRLRAPAASGSHRLSGSCDQCKRGETQSSIREWFPPAKWELRQLVLVFTMAAVAAVAHPSLDIPELQVIDLRAGKGGVDSGAGAAGAAEP